MPTAQRATEPKPVSIEEIRGATESAFQALIEQSPENALDSLETMIGMMTNADSLVRLELQEADLDLGEPSALVLKGERVTLVEIDVSIRQNTTELNGTALTVNTDDDDYDTLAYAVLDGSRVIPVTLPEGVTVSWT